MQHLDQPHTTSSLIPGIDGDVQLVVGSRGLILLDAQGAERGVDGVLRHNHGTVRLTYQSVCELRALLDQIEEPSDARQPRLWSDATFTQPVRRARRAA